LVGKPEDKRHSEDLDIDERIILEWMLGKSVSQCSHEFLVHALCGGVSRQLRVEQSWSVGTWVWHTATDNFIRYTSCSWFKSCIIIHLVDFHCIVWQIMIRNQSSINILTWQVLRWVVALKAISTDENTWLRRWWWKMTPAFHVADIRPSTDNTRVWLARYLQRQCHELDRGFFVIILNEDKPSINSLHSTQWNVW
jgi:hypothetical protein